MVVELSSSRFTMGLSLEQHRPIFALPMPNICLHYGLFG
jgi:hypothetical protein